jgi:hypothetical protein
VHNFLIDTLLTEAHNERVINKGTITMQDKLYLYNVEYNLWGDDCTEQYLAPDPSKEHAIRAILKSNDITGEEFKKRSDDPEYLSVYALSGEWTYEGKPYRVIVEEVEEV